MMSCDLHLRGVKRKLCAEAECDEVELSADKNVQRRQRLNDSVSSSSTEVESLVVISEESKEIAPASPNSLSSRSISDEDDDSDEEEDESEFLDEDGPYGSELGRDSHRLTSAESESGYDERASNSSLSSTSSDSDFAPSISNDPSLLVSIATSSAPIFSRNLPTPLPTSSTFASPVTAVPSNTNRNGLNDSLNVSCAYNMSAASARRSTLPHVRPRPFATTSKDNSHYLRKRQQIFNLSLCKLSRFRQSSDPSLLRSVLICNTLRMLEKELEREGVKINFGPNGVSFISPVPTPSPDLDFVPAFQSPSPPPPSSSYDCAPISESISYLGSTPTENEPYSYPSQCDSSGDNCSDYDKYFSLESGSSSGRATPFLKSFPSSDYPASRSGEASINSAFWTSEDEQVPDRLSSLNWSSMLSFGSSSSSSSPSEISSEPNTRHLSQSRSEMLSTGGSMMTYAEQPESSSSTSSPMLSSSCESASSSSVTFATLLPPASTPSSSSSSLAPNPLLVSQTASSDSYLPSSASSVSSTYYSTASSLPPYSSSGNQSPAITQQACGTSSASSSSSTSYANAPSLMSASYMNSYLSYSTNNDEIFGDIDLSLYDFDIFSPLSPPSVSNKSGPIMSAEELIRNINSSDCNAGSCSNSTSSLLSISHYSVNGFSGQSYTSSNYCTSSSSMTNVVSSITTSSSSINSQLMMSQTVSMPSSSPVNCGSSSAGSGLHLHTASARFFKTPEERDQQTITTIKCHN